MTEIEIKFRSSRRDLSSLMALNGLPPDYILENAASMKIQDIYFDTGDRLLLSQGASLRRRKKGDTLKVTFKSHPIAQANRLTRTEMEEPVSESESRALLEQGVPPSFCADALRDLVGHSALKPGLQVLNSRTVRKVRHRSKGVVAEMALDRVLFLLNGKEMPYHGVEVELAGHGTEADLDAISKGLIERLPDLAPDAESKFQKGMRLLS